MTESKSFITDADSSDERTIIHSDLSEGAVKRPGNMVVYKARRVYMYSKEDEDKMQCAD